MVIYIQCFCLGAFLYYMLPGIWVSIQEIHLLWEKEEPWVIRRLITIPILGTLLFGWITWLIAGWYPIGSIFAGIYSLAWLYQGTSNLSFMMEIHKEVNDNG